MIVEVEAVVAVAVAAAVEGFAERPTAAVVVAEAAAVASAEIFRA